MLKYYFDKIKRKIKYFFRTQYWYHFKKLPSFHLDLDEDTNKWIEEKIPAQSILNSFWNGEKDLLDIIQLKLEYMFYNIKKYAYHSWFYIPADEFFKEEATSRDRSLFTRQIIDGCEKHPENYKYSSFFSKKEFWTDTEYTKTVEKKSRKYKVYAGYENSWRVGFEYMKLPNGELSSVCYYLFHSEEGDGWGYTTTWGLKKTYMDENKNLKEENITYFPSVYTFDMVQEILDEKGIKINVLKGLLNGAQTMDIPDMKVYKKLSPYMKSVAMGKRKSLTKILELRHIVKKLKQVSIDDDKYYNVWKDAAAGKEVGIKIKEAVNLYKEDKKKLYTELFNFLAEYSEDLICD